MAVFVMDAVVVRAGSERVAADGSEGQAVYNYVNMKLTAAAISNGKCKV